MRSVTVPSLSITTQALISVPMAVVVDCGRAPIVVAKASGMWKPSINPPPAATDALMKERRERVCFAMSPSLGLHEFSSAANGLDDALICAATAKVVGHCRLDLGQGRVLAFVEQGGGGHDLTALAIAALRHADLDPRLLDRMRAVLRQPFDGRDLIADRGRRLQLARLHGQPVDMDGAGAAARNAAPVFRSGEPDGIAQHPKQRGLRLDIHRLGLAVDVQGELHECASSHQTGRSLVPARPFLRPLPRPPLFRTSNAVARTRTLVARGSRIKAPAARHKDKPD